MKSGEESESIQKQFSISLSSSAKPVPQEKNGNLRQNSCLQKSQFSSTEPTGLPSRQEAISEQSSKKRFPQRRDQGSKIDKHKIQGNLAGNPVRKRYFSIFDGATRGPTSSILQSQLANCVKEQENDCSSGDSGSSENNLSQDSPSVDEDRSKNLVFLNPNSLRVSPKSSIVKRRTDSFDKDSWESSSPRKKPLGAAIKSKSKVKPLLVPREPRTSCIEALESVAKRYRPGGQLRVHPKSELKDMVKKMTRKIVVRSFSKESQARSERSQKGNLGFSFDNITNKEVMNRKPSRKRFEIALKDGPDNEDPERLLRLSAENSLRIFKDHDSPIKRKAVAFPQPSRRSNNKTFSENSEQVFHFPPQPKSVEPSKTSSKSPRKIPKTPSKKISKLV